MILLHICTTSLLCAPLVSKLLFISRQYISNSFFKNSFPRNHKNLFKSPLSTEKNDGGILEGDIYLTHINSCRLACFCSGTGHCIGLGSRAIHLWLPDNVHKRSLFRVLVRQVSLHIMALEVVVHAVRTLVQAVVMHLQVGCHAVHGHHVVRMVWWQRLWAVWTPATSPSSPAFRECLFFSIFTNKAQG